MLLSKPYWTRLWTLQERALAAELWILWGDEMALWKRLETKYAEVYGSLPFDPHLFPSFAPDDGFQSLQLPMSVQDGDESPLFDLMIDFGELQCKNLRDRA